MPRPTIWKKNTIPMKSIAYEIINKAVCKMTRRVIEPDADDICPANVHKK